MKKTIFTFNKVGVKTLSLSLSLALLGLSLHTKAQLYSSGNNAISGNKVGVGVNAPFATLQINDLSVSSGVPGGPPPPTYPLIRLQSQNATATNYWDFRMDLGSALHFYSANNAGASSEKLMLGTSYVQVFDKFKVSSNIELATAVTPDGTTGSVLSMGLTELGTSGAWQGSGAALFSNTNGELCYMYNTSGNITSTTQMFNQSPIVFGDKGLKLRSLGSNTKVDLIFEDYSLSGSEQRQFVLRSMGANHPDAPNTLLFWDPTENGQAYFTMPIRIGGSFADVSVINSGYGLYVADGIRATTVKVDAYSNWPDYVFAPNYKLMSLKETEEYINQNQHLPGVPSAAEIQETGIDVAEMNAILLKKIEELTLQLIELKKQVDNNNKP